MTEKLKEPLIVLKNVTVFQKEKPVISGLSLRVDSGEFVYLIGKTGSGKSSLLRTLYADLALKTGEAYVAGYNLSKLKRKEIPYLRRKLGIVFQDFQLLSDRSISENFRFVMKATGWKDAQAIQKKTIEILQKVGLGSKIDKMPGELSGGEQQRVSIARALINSPEIILADEPTGNLDPETSDEIMKLLQEISKSGTAVLFATHDFLLFNKYPSRTLKFVNGKAEELTTNKGD